MIDDYFNYKLNDKDYKNYNLENIINKNYKNYNLENTINKDIYKDYRNYISPNFGSSSRGINWGAERTTEPNAYIQPTDEEVQRVLDAVHMMQELPEDQQRMLIEATQEIRYFFDGQTRAEFGATNHFNAIRCLNDPQRTDIIDKLHIPNVQLAGEEFFGLNRFMQNYPDIADIQWWSVYQNGSWRLDTWNPQGEHLDTGINGWGDLVGSVIKLNGKTLTPTETIGFYRTTKLRNEKGFIDERGFQNLQNIIGILSQESLPRRYEQQLEFAYDLGLVQQNGRSLTYQGQSMINTGVTALQRKQRQQEVDTENADQTERRIIVPTIFN